MCKSCSSSTISDNVTGTDPEFINSHKHNWSGSFVDNTDAEWADFRLAPDSPAIDAGANLGSKYTYLLNGNGSTKWPPKIIDQNKYGAGWEIGAFTVATDSVPNDLPSAPTGLRIIQ